MDAEYIQKIQRWVQLDNKLIETTKEIQRLQEVNKPLFDEQKELENDIIDYVTGKNMEMLTINTSDGNIKFSKKSITQSVSLKLLRTLLPEYCKQYPDFNHDDLYNFLVNSLEKKTVFNIKRNFSK